MGRQPVEKSLSTPGFLQGARQAVVAVSNMISQGNLTELRGLVTDEVIHEVKHNFDRLSERQRKYIAVDPNEIFLSFVYSIGYGQKPAPGDDGTRVVEVMVVMQRIRHLDVVKGSNESLNRSQATEFAKENMYVCNYSFRKKCPSVGDGDEDWIITKLNHFRPKEM